MKNTGALRFFISLLWTALIPIVLGQQTNDFANSMQMLQLVNNVRLQKNIRPLCLSEKLVRAAMAHSTYQASINTMTHDGPVSLGDRFIRQGYQPSAVAENVGFTSTPFIQVVFDIWMSSPEHRANILDPNYVHFGAASSQGSNNMFFWTQLFAKPLNLVTEPCDFSAAATAAALTPGQPRFNSNGAWGPSNFNAYTPGMNPSGNCIAIDNGMGGKSLSCRLGGPGTGPNPLVGPNPALGPNPAVGPNPVVGPNPLVGPNPALGPNPVVNPITSPLGPNVINNPPGYAGSSCVVVNTAPAADGQGSVRVLRCRSNVNPPGVGAPGPLPAAHPVGDPVIINPDGGFGDPGLNNPPGYNPPGYNPALGNPPGYNPPGYNPPGYDPVGVNPPGYNPPGYNPPGVNPALGNPPGYNPPGYNPPGYDPLGYNPPGYNPPGYNPVGANPPGYNPPGYNPPGYDPVGVNPPGYNPPGYNPPGYNPPGVNPVAGNPPGYNPPGYNPPGFWS